MRQCSRNLASKSLKERPGGRILEKKAKKKSKNQKEMKMKKILVLVLAVVLCAAFTVPVFAADVPTTVDVVATGSAPFVKCKWEEGMVGGVNADTSSQPGLQINQNPGTYVCNGDVPAFTLGKVGICYLAVVTHPISMSLVNAVYADVYHPNVKKLTNLTGVPTSDSEWCGSFKYELRLDPFLTNDNTAAVAAFQAAYNKGLVTLEQGVTPADVIEEILQGEAELYKGCEYICTHQPAGEYTVKVWAATGAAQSNILINILTVNQLNSFLLDFTGVSYGQVAVGFEKQIGVDTNMCTPLKPTVWNNGNVYINLKVMQDDAGFGQTSTQNGIVWNVHWAARLGDEQVGVKVAYDPFTTVTLPNVLVMCTPAKLDFFILIDKAISGPKVYSGAMTITSVVVPFGVCATGG